MFSKRRPATKRERRNYWASAGLPSIARWRVWASTIISKTAQPPGRKFARWFERRRVGGRRAKAAGLTRNIYFYRTACRVGSTSGIATDHVANFSSEHEHHFPSHHFWRRRFHRRLGVGAGGN